MSAEQMLDDGLEPLDCPGCRGTGEEPVVDDYGRNTTHVCLDCHGTGEVRP